MMCGYFWSLFVYNWKFPFNGHKSSDGCLEGCKIYVKDEVKKMERSDSFLWHSPTMTYAQIMLTNPRLFHFVYFTVDADEIRRLGKRFKKLDLDNSGALSIDEFMSLPELQQNPLVQRVIDIFDADGNGEVDFKEFIHGVSQFSVKGDKLSKLKFAFRIYDMDNDGFISNGELFQVSNRI